MPEKAHFIGPYDFGLETGERPWLLTDDAFSLLRNVYTWRNRVKKRIGSELCPGNSVKQLGSRLRIDIPGGAAVGITDGGGNATAIVPGAVGAIGQMFSIGTVIYTVTTIGVAQPMLRTDGTTTATFDTTNGTYVFAGAPATTQVYWYPALPVMGLMNYEDAAINAEPTFGFDTIYSYKKNTNGWVCLDPTVQWSGTDSQFFWGTIYRGTLNDNNWLFVVNNNQADQIKFWNGAAWVTFAPATLPAPAVNYTLHSARLIVSFKDRLIALNTIEQVGAALPALNFSNRARWCQNGDPVAADAWHDIPGRGSYLEAPTRQAIITAKILKDRLIVYFERSTWELVYTGNHVLPFVWQIIDAELGAESTFSSVLFDNEVLGVGQNGIHSCNGLQVTRIDEKIPDEVFKIHNGNEGVERVAGIRDYVSELAYWTFPNNIHNTTYPDRMMVYNYRNKTWAFFDDSITTFGYYQNPTDIAWAEDTALWEIDDGIWGSGAGQSLYRNVIAGNQQGFTFLMNNKLSRNSPCLQITNVDVTAVPGQIIITVINHNLTTDPLINTIAIERVSGMTRINNKIYTIVATTATTITVQNDPDFPATGTYTGGGVITRISYISMRTKNFNFYTSAKRMAISRLELDVDKTANGIFYVTFYPSTSSIPIGKLTGELIAPFKVETSPDLLYLTEFWQKRLVKRIYPNAEGDSIKLEFSTDYAKFSSGYYEALSNFTLNSMTFYSSPTATR